MPSPFRGRHWGRSTLLLIALAAAIAVVLPAVASATVFTVNTTADEIDKAIGTGGCETAVAGKCSLRAAIQESNASAGVADEIKFASDPFNGENGDTIGTATPMPTIIDQVAIKGGECDTAAGIKGPCAGVIKAGVGLLFVVEDDGVEIQRLAINGGSAGILVSNASENFTAKGNWIGFDITGAPSGNGTGIFIDPGSNGATIGGPEPAERNVIGKSAVIGLDVEGASGTKVQGNYFGVTPKGDAAAANGKSIEVTDSLSSPGFKAEDTDIGATLSAPAAASAACDGGCNVISGGGTGVDLTGNGAGENEAPASGPTTVHGNFVGLNAAGTGVFANGLFDVLSGAADKVKIGGTAPANSNWIAGGGNGIYHENGDDFEAIGNVIGEDVGGAATSPPGVGIFAFGLSSTDSPVLEGNQIRASNIGIENRFRGAEIIDNTISGAFNGIYVYADNGGVGNIIEGNVVRDSGNSSMTIENNGNEVFGNEFDGSDFSTIFIKGSATENRIGGDTPESENLFLNSEYNPIAMITTETTQNEVARNRGEENALSGGGFIFINKAAGAEPNFPNGGIVPPAIVTALQSTIAGTAEPEARVRVFRKATEFGGELKSFLGEAIADENGDWKVTYPVQVPTGTFVAATQTNTDGGTSEVAYATSAADPPGPPGPEEGGKGGGGGGGGTDNTAPETKIAKKPKLKGAPTAKFKFTSTIAGSSFECKLDKKPFKKCRSPKTYKKLKPGKHVFKVRAVSPAGVKDPSPATKKFKVNS